MTVLNTQGTDGSLGLSPQAALACLNPHSSCQAAFFCSPSEPSRL